MNKEHVLAEIRRTATENGNTPLGRLAFLTETGIKESEWRGKYWARWSEAVREAGFEPNQKQEPYSTDHLLERLIELIRELGCFPVYSEIRLKSNRDSTFPTDRTFARFGAKQDLVGHVVRYCESHPGREDILRICSQTAPSSVVPAEPPDNGEEFGFVYLLRSGRFYKIGKSNAAGRRERELAIQLPEKAATVHVIRTDDPGGIEAYWHNRFAEKRMNGEWFALTPADVKAFRRRKFM